MCLPGCLAGYWSNWLTGCLSVCLIWLAGCRSACSSGWVPASQSACLSFYLARWLAVSLCVLSGWLDAFLSTCPCVCQLTSNLLSPRTAKCFAHAQNRITQISLVYCSLPQTKTAEYKEEAGRRSRRPKRREELLLSFARNE